MKATDILNSEHRVIERVITSLEKAAEKTAKGEQVRPGFYIETADFIKGFADGCHHKKEEGVLFKTMNQFGMPTEGGPIAVMLYEHEQGRKFTRGLREAAIQLQNGDLKVIPTLLENANGYANLLRHHIHIEDNILFPMANRVIPSTSYDQVTENFEHVEHEETGEGVHEKYLALAENLVKEANQ